MKYSIYASVLGCDDLQSIDLTSANLSELSIDFNVTYNSFNVCLLQVVEHTTLVFQLLKRTVDQMFDDIKFVLSYDDLNIPPSIKELLNSFLFTSYKVSTWCYGLDLVSKGNSQIKTMLIDMIKKEPIPLQRRKTANLIHHCFDYYESLELYKNWLICFEGEINRLLASTNDRESV